MVLPPGCNFRSNKWAILPLLFFILSCSGPTLSPGTDEIKENKEQITRLAARVEMDISKSGPGAWLNYFEDSPAFFMASNGNLVFNNYQTAHDFILNTLIKTIAKISLKWKNIRIDAYTNEWGYIGADFHEELTDTSGKTMSIDGYFSATAHKTGNGWKLRNVHWSIKPTGKTLN